MYFRQITDPHLAQNAYLIGCQRSGEALIIDPQRDVDRYVEIAAAEDLRIVAATETHIHADYLSGVREFADRHGVRVYLSAEGGEDWQYGWLEGSDYDSELLHDGDSFRIGNIELRALHTPGHTPEHLSFLVIDHGSGIDEPMGLASGDFVFVGDLGRPDLLESALGVAEARDPSARALYRSVQDFLDLPDFLQVWPGHGAGSACGKALGAVPSSTVGYEKRFNGAIGTARVSEDAFVESILHGQPEPPLYFGRMKQLNRSGPPLLGDLPSPPTLTAADLPKVLAEEGAVLIDTRANRQDFMRGHLPGSLYAPLGKTFSAVVGSYVSPDQDLYLLIDHGRVAEAVRDLIRIGLDRIVGLFPYAAYHEHVAAGGELSTIDIVDFSAIESTLGQPGHVVLDVRGAAEFETSHIPGALNIAHTRLLARRDELPKGGKLLVHCRTGQRASYASAFLEREGRDVAYVDDLFANWEQG